MPPTPLVASRATWLFNLLTVLFFVGVAVVLYVPYLNHMPEGIHAWAQCDRYSLAVGFYDWGMNFFRPRVLNMSSIDGITGVELPILPYLAALLGKVFGRDTIMPIYRILTITVSLVGCYFLARLVFEQTGKLVVAWVPGVFLLLAPCFAYYSGNFLPDTVGASVTLIAYYYFIRHTRAKHFRDLAIAVGLLALATLIKTSAGIYLGAVLGITFLLSYLREKHFSLQQKVVFLVLLSMVAGAVVGYLMFNLWLNTNYKSEAFLMEARPIDTAQAYDAVITAVREEWWNEYFTPVHYAVLVLSLLVVLVSVRYMIRTQRVLLEQILLALVGGFIFFWAMGSQLTHHDYYILSPYMPVLTLVVVLAAIRLGTWYVSPWVTQGMAGLVVVGLLAAGIPKFHARMNEPYPPFSDYYDYKWMRGGADVLRRVGVPSVAKVLIIGELAPNIGPVYFDRRGMVWRPDNNEAEPDAVVEMMEQYGLDYVIVRRSALPNAMLDSPSWTGPFEPVASNSDYVVMRWREPVKHW